MKFFTDAELQRLLDPGEVISALRSAFVRGFADLQMPPRSHLEVENGTVLIMPCAIAGDPICGVKIVSVLATLVSGACQCHVPLGDLSSRACDIPKKAKHDDQQLSTNENLSVAKSRIAHLHFFFPSARPL